MSKISFRVRALDVMKPLPIYNIEEIPDVNDLASMNRSVPQMPTGMEKEEELEHHLQQAITAQQQQGHIGALVIPTPDVETLDEETYDRLYPANYQMPKQLVHIPPPMMIDDERPEYDMDSEDEMWLAQHAINGKLSKIQFESLLDQLEKVSQRTVIEIDQAKALLKLDDESLYLAVYDYWLNKRLRTQCPLIPLIPMEKRDCSNATNPYVAFRRRCEKMQTRKNRKNDERSYEKILQLQRDLNRAMDLLGMVKEREKLKYQQIQVCVDIFDKMFDMGDFDNRILHEVMAEIRQEKAEAAAAALQRRRELATMQARYRPYPIHRVAFGRTGFAKRIRSDHKRRKIARQIPAKGPTPVSSDEDEEPETLGGSTADAEDVAFDPSKHPDGEFTFRRKRNCVYLQPKTELREDKEPFMNRQRHRFVLAACPSLKWRGYVRRRVGRGGRIMFDRVALDHDENSLSDGFEDPFQLEPLVETQEHSCDEMDVDPVFVVAPSSNPIAGNGPSVGGSSGNGLPSLVTPPASSTTAVIPQPSVTLSQANAIAAAAALQVGVSPPSKTPFSEPNGSITDAGATPTAVSFASG